MMLNNCIFILPVSDPGKQADQVVKHHVFDGRTVITQLEEIPGDDAYELYFDSPVSDPGKQAAQVVKHHVFDERTVIPQLEETPGDDA